MCGVTSRQGGVSWLPKRNTAVLRTAPRTGAVPSVRGAAVLTPARTRPGPTRRDNGGQSVGPPQPAVGVRGLHPLPQVGAEPGGRCAVDDVVVDGDGEVEDVADDDFVAERSRPPAQPADHDHAR